MLRIFVFKVCARSNYTRSQLVFDLILKIIKCGDDKASQAARNKEQKGGLNDH